MTSRRDPIETASDGDRDLYDVATWDPRTVLDKVSVWVFWLLTRGAKVLVVAIAFLILLSLGLLSAISDPAIGTLTVLSAIPALALAGYVWYSDVKASEPLTLLVATFLLSILTATFAALINSVLRGAFPKSMLGNVVFFFIIVGPVEESVKLLAVRLYAYTDSRFDAVVDGAVYGALAGLGFATIENALYISQQVDAAELGFGFALIGAGEGITALRALAGPGHVIYSAFAGYYLGLAKFNPGQRGPIVIKGIIIAAVIHATYNSTVGIGSGAIGIVTGLGSMASFFVYVLLFDGLFGLILLRKIWRYRNTYREVHSEVDEDISPELAEFEE